MAEICDACYDPEGYRQVLAVIARRLQETGERWRMAYKALLLLEYLIKHGPEKVWRDVQQSGSVLQRLGRFEYVDGNQRDHGVNVRHRAQEIQGLVNDEGRVREERRKAAENKAKYSGYSASQMRTGGGGGGFGGGVGGGVGSRTTTTTTATMKNPSSYDGFFGDGQSTRERRQGNMGGDLALGDEGDRGPKLDPVSATQARIASMKISNREVQYDDPVDDGKPAKKKLSDVRANPKIAASLGLKVAAAPASADSAKPKGTATGSAGHGAVDLLGTGSGDAATGRGENNAGAWDPFGEAEGGAAATAAAKEEEAVFDPFAVLDAPSKPAAAVDPFAAVVAAPSPKTETTKGDELFADLLG